MDVVKRLQKLKQLGRQQSVEYHIDRALEINGIGLDNVESMKTLVAMDGWKSLSYLLQTKLAQKRLANDSLCADPEKNRIQLIVNHCMIELTKRILSLVEGTLKEEAGLKQERLELISKTRSSDE
jgi:hypothetical protein